MELHEQQGGRHQTFTVENADLVRARVIDELKVNNMKRAIFILLLALCVVSRHEAHAQRALPRMRSIELFGAAWSTGSAPPQARMRDTISALR